MMYEYDQGTSLTVEKLAMGENPAHVLTRILVPARRCSAESVDDNNIYLPPV